MPFRNSNSEDYYELHPQTYMQVKIIHNFIQLITVGVKILHLLECLYFCETHLYLEEADVVGVWFKVQVRVAHYNQFPKGNICRRTYVRVSFLNKYFEINVKFFIILLES